MKNCFCLILVCSLAGCSNWQLKERCENTNWFEYSQNLSFQGKYLEEDGFVKDCKSLDRSNAVQLDQGFKLGREKMCTYDEIYSRAKQGEPVFFNFCDGLQFSSMKKKFQEGLSIFCTADQGYLFGKSGRTYKKVCSAESEKKFLPFYNKGRREYLTEYIKNTQTDLERQSVKIKSLSVSEQNAAIAYHSIPHVLQCRAISVYNEHAKTSHIQNVCEEPFYIQSQRSGLYSGLSDARESLKVARTAYTDLQKQIQWAELELTMLPPESIK